MSKVLPVPPAWQRAITDYTIHLRASGAAATSIRTYGEHLRHLGRHIGIDDPFTVDGHALVLFTGRQTWLPESRRNRRQTYLGFYRWAKLTKQCRKNPAKMLPKVRAAEPVSRPAPDRIYHEAVMRSQPRERLWLRLAGEMGLRRGEVATVSTDDLFQDLVGWSLLVHGKGGKDRVVPCTPGIARELMTMPGGFAFPGGRNGHVSPEYVGKRVARLMEGEWTMHALRHRFANRTYDIDNDLLGVQELLGHASPSTTRRYIGKRAGARLHRLVHAASSELVNSGLTTESRTGRAV